MTENEKEKHKFRAHDALACQLRSFTTTVTGLAAAGAVIVAAPAAGALTLVAGGAGAVAGGYVTDEVLPNRTSFREKFKNGEKLDAIIDVGFDAIFGAFGPGKFMKNVARRMSLNGVCKPTGKDVLKESRKVLKEEMHENWKNCSGFFSNYQCYKLDFNHLICKLWYFKDWSKINSLETLRLSGELLISFCTSEIGKKTIGELAEKVGYSGRMIILSSFHNLNVADLSNKKI